MEGALARGLLLSAKGRPWTRRGVTVGCDLTTFVPCSPFRTFPPASSACLNVRNRGVDQPRLRASHNRITLHPEYGRFVAAFCGTFRRAVADHGFTQGAAPASSSAITRVDTSRRDHASQHGLAATAMRPSFANGRSLSPRSAIAFCCVERRGDPPYDGQAGGVLRAHTSAGNIRT